ncbi:MULTISPECIES: polymer-forming cytoskeletal protein [unclassified Meiothermus]|uniref:bactofilin family protein n=1 Tax=unclassified Meiothermus TaxID=370471 RepID=UPI000D7C8690|nr:MULTISPECIES: polymer-forming cytoskeletal protein [unclassified Meiothermus]PZA05792.1 polymer-forming cytoskeletal protein [Meiothermus sp. Pnk-1]RYM27485.1 polymer-forming cytoskeletal protein [Meiothermus sp. PNK-Is4]
MLSRKSNPAALTYLGEGTELEGVLKARGSVRIDGRVQGTVVVEGDLEVGPKGEIKGELVQAVNIQIHGTVRSQVIAQEKLMLLKTARLEGDVCAKALDIEAGAAFIGHSHTGEPRALPQPE